MPNKTPVSNFLKILWLGRGFEPARFSRRLLRTFTTSFTSVHTCVRACDTVLGYCCYYPNVKDREKQINFKVFKHFKIVPLKIQFKIFFTIKITFFTTPGFEGWVYERKINGFGVFFCRCGSKIWIWLDGSPMARRWFQGCRIFWCKIPERQKFTK
jgi:hypothetical protein